jgi:hypothetical protein
MDYQLILETYSLEEILELNDITQEEALIFLVDQGFLNIPDPKPVDCFQ